MIFTKLWRNRMSVIARTLLVSMFLIMLIGCSNNATNVAECSSTGTYTIISSDGQYNTDYCIK